MPGRPSNPHSGCRRRRVTCGGGMQTDDHKQEANAAVEEIILRFKGANGFVLSKTLGTSEPIAGDGIHRGILLNGRVYDNVHKHGLPLETWLNDFEGLGERIVERRPFGGNDDAGRRTAETAG